MHESLLIRWEYLTSHNLRDMNNELSHNMMVEGEVLSNMWASLLTPLDPTRQTRTCVFESFPKPYVTACTLVWNQGQSRHGTTCTPKELDVLLDKWIADGVFKPNQVSRELTEQEQRDSRFCRLHNYVQHPTAECWVLRRLVHRRIKKGTLRVSSKHCLRGRSRMLVGGSQNWQSFLIGHKQDHF